LLLVGLPLNMDDTESDMSQRARRFAAALSKRTGIEHEMVDERLSSFAAKKITSGKNRSTSSQSRAAHSIAAALIAETWLNQRR
jgi:putative Holliday junction resolvase